MTELAVLVPVLNRPQNVAPLVESFLAGTPQSSELVFLVDEGDTEELAEIISVEDNIYVRHLEVTVETYTWPRKINAGVAHVLAEWYLLAADDIEFVPGWWEATRPFRRKLDAWGSSPRFSVIGTNDLANPRVIAGEHSTHTLVRGSYIREYGTIDEPGKAVHDGYRHVFVDDELVWTAKHRGVWAHATDAYIKHRHPLWGTAEWDDTYLLGNADEVYAHDKALFCARAPMFGVQCQ